MPPRITRGLAGVLGAWLVLSWPAARPAPVRPERVEGRASTLRVENAEHLGLQRTLTHALTGLEEPPIRVEGPDGPIDWRAMGWPETPALRQFLAFEREWLDQEFIRDLAGERERFQRVYSIAPDDAVLRLSSNRLALHGAQFLVFDLDANWYVFVQYLAIHERLRDAVGHLPGFQVLEEHLRDDEERFVGDLQRHLAEGDVIQARPKAFFEERLLALGMRYPRFRRYGDLLVRWDALGAESIQRMAEIRDRQGGASLQKAFESLDSTAETSAEVVQQTERDQWLRTLVREFGDLMRDAHPDEAFEHPVEFLATQSRSALTVNLSWLPISEPSFGSRMSGDEMPAQIEFYLAWFDRMGQGGWRQWCFARAAPFLQPMLTAFPADQMPTIQELLQRLQAYLDDPRHPETLPVIEALGIPTSTMKTDATRKAFRFWRRMKQLRQQHQARVVVFRDLGEDRYGQHPIVNADAPGEVPRFEQWLAETHGVKRLILGRLYDDLPWEGKDVLGAYHDPAILRIQHLLARPTLDMTYFSLDAVIEHLPALLRRMGDFRSIAVMIRGNRRLDAFVEHFPEAQHRALTGTEVTVQHMRAWDLAPDAYLVTAGDDDDHGWDKPLERPVVPQHTPVPVSSPATGLEEFPVVRDRTAELVPPSPLDTGA